MGWKWPFNRYQCQSSETCERTSFCRRCDSATDLERGHFSRTIQWTLNSVTYILTKREAGGVLRDTLRRRRWCEDGGWDWSDVAWRHRTLAASRGWTRQRTDSPRSLWSEGGPVNTLFLSTKSGDLSFWSSGLQNYERIPVVFSRRVCDNFLYREIDIPSTKSKRAAKPDWVTGLGCPEGVSIYYTAYYYKSRVMNFDWSKFLWSSLAGNPPNLSPRLGPAPETLLLTLLPMDSTPAPR